MKFTSLEHWYLKSRDWTGFIVRCPVAGLRDDVTKALIGTHEIDGEPYEVIAVESPCTMRLSENTEISLMVRGNIGKQL